MLIVRPLTDPNDAERSCRFFGRPSNPDVLTFLAVEAKDQNDKSPIPLVLCRFTLKGGKDEIVSLDYAKGVHDTEALIITARTVMNFMYRCSVKTVYLSEEISEDLALSLGFRKVNGRFAIDLEEFYKSPCGYRA